MRKRTTGIVVMGLVLALGVIPAADAEVGTETATVSELGQKMRWKKVNAATLDILRFTNDSSAFFYAEIGGANATAPLTFRVDVDTDCIALTGGTGGSFSQRINVIIDPAVHPSRGALPMTIPGAGPRACFSTTDIVGRTPRTVKRKVEFLEGPAPVLLFGVTRIDDATCFAPGTTCREGVQCCSGMCAAGQFDPSDPTALLPGSFECQ